MLIWRISGSLRLSQNFVKNWKFSWPRSLAKFQILTTFSRLSFQTCESGLQVSKWYSRVFFVDLKDFWKFEVRVKILSKIENFHDRGLSEISDFDHFLKTFISDLWVNCKYQNGILKCSLLIFEGFLEVWGWVKILSKIENFHDCDP